MYNPSKPYNNLPLLPPEINILTPKIFSKTITANKELAELKGIGELIPNQAILINGLVLREAKDSSEVENIVTTQDSLYKAFTTEAAKIDPYAKEVLNYSQALWTGFNRLKKRGMIATNDIVYIQEVLIQNNAGIRNQAGTKLTNAKTGKTIFTPPEGEERIRSLLKNFEEYLNIDSDTDPLIKMAILHYQFETIHPFFDGNGRTGRILNILFLIQRELLNLPVLYLSSYIIQHKAKYYKGLTDVRKKNDWEPWILFILEGVEHTARHTINMIKDIQGLLRDFTLKIRTKLPSIYSRELIELLFQQPYCKVKHLVDAKIVARQQASVYLQKLSNAGILRYEKVGREKLYINDPLIDTLGKK